MQVFHTTGSYSAPADLGGKIEDRLRVLAAQDGSPWCKVGRAVFRARRFTDGGDRLTVEATVRDGDVIAALEELRGDQWGRGGNTRVTCAGRTYAARVDSLTVEAEGGRARQVRLEATRVADENRSTLLDVAYESRSPEDLTELAVRVALFGEPNPLGSMSFFAEMANPFEVLNALELGEDAIPAVAEVLLVEELVGSGRADRINALRVGPNRHGSRRVLLEWLPRRRYTNVVPEPRSVEGEVRA